VCCIALHNWLGPARSYGRGEAIAAALVQTFDEMNTEKLAVIRSSAVNQDGRSSGLTAPNGPAQATLVKEVLQRVGFPTTAVEYLAMHGTGTPLGDPIEVNALGQVFSSSARTSALTMGSVKSCFGHTEGTAGLTGKTFTVHTYCRSGGGVPGFFILSQ
jgi:3-oxoacyl-(acyl-carrier-protein) synthase